jgi:hypothetical protein
VFQFQQNQGAFTNNRPAEGRSHATRQRAQDATSAIRFVPNRTNVEESRLERGIGAQSNSSLKINDKELGSSPGRNAKRKKKKRKKQEEEKQREKLTRSLHASRP